MKKHNIHLAVDGIRTHDGQQLKKGFTHDLQSPVYVGHGQFQRLHKTYVRMCNFLISASSLTTSLVFLYKVITFFSQGEVPQKSIIGCIRDLRVSKVLFAHPAVNHGIMPCFKGVTEKGAYFAGNGAYLVLGLSHHVDTCVYSDRKIGLKKLNKCFSLAEKYLISGSTYDLAFEIRPRNLTGLIFHKTDNHGWTLTLFLKRGKVNKNIV